MLEFPFQAEPVSVPPPSLPPSERNRWRPLVPIRIYGSTGKSRMFTRALVDTGSDDTVFPMGLISPLDVDLLDDTGHGIRWRGRGYSLRFGTVELELTDGGAVWRWTAIVGFSTAPIRYPILGQTAFLQFFNASFRGDDRVITLVKNSSFP